MLLNYLSIILQGHIVENFKGLDSNSFNRPAEDPREKCMFTHATFCGSSLKTDRTTGNKVLVKRFFFAELTGSEKGPEKVEIVVEITGPGAFSQIV
jgi:hypothetical protein